MTRTKCVKLPNFDLAKIGEMLAFLANFGFFSTFLAKYYVKIFVVVNLLLKISHYSKYELFTFKLTRLQWSENGISYNGLVPRPKGL